MTLNKNLLAEYARVVAQEEKMYVSLKVRKTIEEKINDFDQPMYRRILKARLKSLKKAAEKKNPLPWNLDSLKDQIETIKDILKSLPTTLDEE